MLSPEERKKVLNTLLFGGFWPTDCEPPLSPAPEYKVINVENYGLLLANVEQINKEDLDEDSYLKRLYRMIIDLRNAGALIRKTVTTRIVHLPPPPPDFAATLPHDDIPALKNIRNINDVSRVKNMPKDRLKQFMFLKAPVAGVQPIAFQHLNERMQYIIDHKLEGPETLVEEKTATARKPIFSTPPEVTQAHELVDAMTLADIGSVNSNEGPRTALAKRQKRFHADIDFAYANRVPATKILEDTQASIKKSGESSIS